MAWDNKENLLYNISRVLNHTHAHRLIMKLGADIGLNDDNQEELVNRIETFIEETMIELLDEQDEQEEDYQF